MKKAVAITGIVVVLAAGAAVAMKFSPDIQAKQRATDRISTLLNDPASAQFRNVRVVSGRDNEPMICGEVNAKNKFGGYTGFTDFYVEDVENGVALIDPGPDPIMMPGLLWMQHKKYCI